MAVTPMEAAIESQARQNGNAEQPTVPFPKILDEDGNPIQLPIREMTGGQGIMLMNLQIDTRRRDLTAGDKAKKVAKFYRMVVSLVDDEDLRDEIESGLWDGTIEGDDLNDLFEQIAEIDAGRPTESSPASSPSRETPGSTSTVKSQRRVSASKRARSGGSAT